MTESGCVQVCLFVPVRHNLCACVRSCASVHCVNERRRGRRCTCMCSHVFTCVLRA